MWSDVVDSREEGRGKRGRRGGEEEVSPCLWKGASKSDFQTVVF